MKYAILFIATIILIACAKDENTDDIDNPSISYEGVSYSSSDSVQWTWLHDSIVVDTTTTPGVVRLSPHVDYKYFGEKSDGDVEAYSGIMCVRCDCGSTQSGCTPVVRPNVDIRCKSKATCEEACTKVEYKCGGSGYVAGGYVNVTQNVEIFSTSVSGEVPNVFKNAHKHDPIKDSVAAFINEYLSGNDPSNPGVSNGIVTAPSGENFVPINILGRVVYMIVPNNTDSDYDDAKYLKCDDTETVVEEFFEAGVPYYTCPISTNESAPNSAIIYEVVNSVDVPIFESNQYQF